MKYRPEVDGLRAVAVIPVILFHAGFSFFSGGYIGVDIFFVISGYLITAIIYKELENGDFSIINFYEKRSRRILPLLFFVVFVSVPFAWFGLFNQDMIDFSQSLVAIPSFSSNFLFWLEADYFDTVSELKPMLHTWSLAVEEQFYLFFPVTLLLIWKINKKFILPSIIMVGVVSSIFAQWASVNYPTANFYLLPSRAWELAIGSVVGLIIHNNSFNINSFQSTQLANILSWIGLFMIAYSIIIFDGQTPYPSFFTLVPTLGTAMIIIFSASKTSLGLMLSNRFLVTIGLISYSAYLWHQPLFAFTRHMFSPEPDLILNLFLCILVFPISYLSWKFVESPFRNKQKYTRSFIFSFSLIGSLLMMALGYYGYHNEGLPNRSLNQELNVLNYEPDNRLLQEQSWRKIRNDENRKDGLWFNENNETPNLLLVGNSHSKDMYNVFLYSNEVKNHFEIGRISADVYDLKEESSAFWSDINYNLSDVVFLVARYYEEDLPYLEDVIKRFINDGKVVVVTKEIFNFKVAGSKTVADIIVQNKIRGINGALDHIDIREVIKNSDMAYFQDYNENYVKRPSDKILDEIKSEYKNVILLDRMDYICDNRINRCYSINDQFQKYFYDYGHHTISGSKSFAARMDSISWLNPLYNKFN